jgi:phosphate transport system substrate-binding protein
MRVITTFIILTLILTLASSCNSSSKSPSDTNTVLIKIGGSSSAQKVITALKISYKQKKPDVIINCEINNSSDGIKGVMEGKYEIGLSSRALKTSETELEAIPYAIDGIAIIVNNKNVITGLTKDQLLKIFTGVINNWKDIGGKDNLITVISRKNTSATRALFEEYLGFKTNEAHLDYLLSTTDDVISKVSTTEYTIGYSSFSALMTTVKTLKLDTVQINTKNIEDGTYKLKRYFYVITKKGTALSNNVKDFINFILSPQGQNIVSKNNLVKIK